MASSENAVGEETLLQSKTRILRVFFIVSLLAAAAICGSIVFIRIRDLEEDVGRQTYESVAASALRGARAILHRKQLGGVALASFLSTSFPDSSQWPFVALQGFATIAGNVGDLSETQSHGMNIIVQPDQVAEFERFAQRTYMEYGYPETKGVSDFGFGVWARSETSIHSDGKVPSTSGNTTWGSPNKIVVPVFQHSNENTGILMFDLHSDELRGKAIDSMIECAVTAGSTAHCAVVTESLELFRQPGPAALIYQPIFAADNRTIVVGSMGTTVHWAEILIDVVPNYVDGLVCVLSGGQDTYTYQIVKGIPELIGRGDFHISEYDNYAHSRVLNRNQTDAAASVVYTLTVYPSEEMFNHFRTNSPLALSLGFVAVILFCAALFFLYDFFMQHESHQRKVILELKRRFVRFVSHEIRTPLNTVCLGLELLQTELDEAATAASRETTLTERTNPPKALSDDLKYWLNLTGDIHENSSNAVAILNDLLNYDKIETSSFKLEIGLVDIWPLLMKTVSAFRIQAKRGGTMLNISISDDEGETQSSGDAEEGVKDRKSMLRAIGDDMRLRQVFRNVVSNALKFSPETEGVIDVKAVYVPDGLHNARTLKDELPRDEARYGECGDLPQDGSIRISVTDNGIGLNSQQQSELFDEGVQFNANKLQLGGGSGLGLYITKSLVEQHGGTITVDSQGVGHGTTFTIELPLFRLSESDRLYQRAAQAEVLPVNETMSNTGTKQQVSALPDKRHKVLVVDDVLSNRKMLVRLLERAGHICETATNGREAVDAVVADRLLCKADPDHSVFDTILMDYEMPVLNGPNATKELRDSGCVSFIVGVTGNVLAEDVAYFRRMGANDVLPKPVSMMLLEECWRKGGESHSVGL